MSTVGPPRCPLGTTGLSLSRVGCGGWQLGGGELSGPRPAADDDRRVRTIAAALAAGINWIDTAAVYGLGHGERLVAAALRGLHERPLIFSKAGYVWDDRGRITQCLEPATLRRGLEDSLRRLEVEAIDLYQIHWPVPDEEISDAWAALLEFQATGLVRHVGVSNFSVEQMERCRALGAVEACQPPYSLAAPAAATEILPYCAANSIGVIVYSPQASGLLAGTVTRETVAGFAPDDDRRGDPVFQEPMLTRGLELHARLRHLGDEHGLPPSALAIAWTLLHPAVTGAIVGLDDPVHVADAVRAASELDVFRAAVEHGGLLAAPR